MRSACVCVCACVLACVRACARARVCVCDAMHNIACARSVSENVGLLLKYSYVVSENVYLVLFLGNAFVPR